MLRTAFMGTPDFAVQALDALHERSQVVAVVCQPDKKAGRGMKLKPPAVKRRALELGLDVLQPRRIRSPKFRTQFAELAPEIVIVAAYGKILPQDLLDEVPRGFVNVHASRLPRLRGAAPIHRAVLEGEAESGVSIMRLVMEMDEGPVYLERTTPIRPDDTAGTLHDRLATIGAEALGEFLDRVNAGEDPEPVEQIHSEATYAPKLDPAEFEIQWERSAVEVDRQIRGLSPFPGGYSFWGTKRVKMLGSARSPGALWGQPGEVVAFVEGAPVVACGDGGIVLTRVQPAGKKAMAAADFVRGARIEIGVRFGPKQEEGK